MPKFSVEKSIQINAPQQQVFEILKDMSQWPAWNPWLVAEPDAKVKSSDDRSYYEWDGSRIGSGNMTVRNTRDKDVIEYNLQFLKPWKSTADITMKLAPDANGTKVTWHMNSSLPWFMFWMKKQMTAYIGSDYDRGLLNLKDYAEEGRVHSKMDFEGIRTVEGTDYIGLERKCSIDQMPALMEQDLHKLAATCEDLPDADMRKVMVQYKKWDFVNRTCIYKTMLPVAAVPANLGSEWTSGTLSKAKVYRIKHTGAYRHLGNAWSTASMMARNKEIKPIKNFHPFETYGNSPKDTKENDLITYINFPVKG